MQTQPIQFDDIQDRLITMTDLRRRPGEIFSKLPMIGGYLVIKDGKTVGKIVPVNPPQKSIDEKLAIIKSIAGSFKLGKGSTPEELNKQLDDRYAKMLPR